ncbi:MAG TPA: hypothetical protein VHO70_22495, partial [Chitinispirillaceae bacterium]|nr:hypothetical protein [Chitinispirillaceae bacterium]
NSSQSIFAVKYVNGEMTGWTEDSYSQFSASELINFVNGDAPKYVSRGLIEGFDQSIVSSGKSARLLIMDFATDDNALNMFNFKANDNTSKIKAGDNYDLNTAQLNTSAADAPEAYAHFGQYFLELRLDGFSDPAEGQKAATNLVELLDSKISQMK